MKGNLFDLFQSATSAAGINIIPEPVLSNELAKFKIGENFANVKSQDGWPRTGSLRVVKSEDGSVFQELLYKEFSKTGILRRIYTPPEEHDVLLNKTDFTDIPNGTYTKLGPNGNIGLMADGELHFYVTAACNVDIDENTVFGFDISKIVTMRPGLTGTYTVTSDIPSRTFTIKWDDATSPPEYMNSYVDTVPSEFLDSISFGISTNTILDNLFTEYNFTVTDGVILRNGFNFIMKIKPGYLIEHDHYAATLKLEYDCSLLSLSDIWESYIDVRAIEANGNVFEVYVFGNADAPISAVWFPGYDNENMPVSLPVQNYIYFRIIRSNGSVAIDWSADNVTWATIYSQKMHNSVGLKYVDISFSGTEEFNNTVRVSEIKIENGILSEPWSEWQEILDGEVALDLSSIEYPNDFGTISTLNEAFIIMNKQMLKRIQDNISPWTQEFVINRVYGDGYGFQDYFFLGATSEEGNTVFTGPQVQWADNAYMGWHNSILALKSGSATYDIQSVIKVKTMNNEPVSHFITTSQESDFNDGSNDFSLNFGFDISLDNGAYAPILDTFGNALSVNNSIIQMAWDTPRTYLNLKLLADQKYGVFDNLGNRLAITVRRTSVSQYGHCGVLDETDDTTFYWDCPGPTTFNVYSDAGRTNLISSGLINPIGHTSKIGIISFTYQSQFCYFYFDNTIALDEMFGHYRFLPVRITDFDIRVKRRF